MSQRIDTWAKLITGAIVVGGMACSYIFFNGITDWVERHFEELTRGQERFQLSVYEKPTAVRLAEPAFVNDDDIQDLIVTSEIDTRSILYGVLDSAGTLSYQSIYQVHRGLPDQSQETLDSLLEVYRPTRGN